MQGELVSTITEDRTRLNGFLVMPQPQPAGPVDAALIVHGLGGSFYGSTLLLELASRMTRLGIAGLVANTRGHDLLNWTLHGGRTGTNGAAVESVDDCRHDLAGWISFLVRQGYRRVLIVGHSLGAIKALYSQAHQPHQAVVRIAAISPTRLNAQKFLASPAGPIFRGTLEAAQSLADSGQGDQLMRVEFPFPTWISAAAYLAKYGLGNRYDWFGFVERIKVPTQILFGGRELSDNPAFTGLEQELPAISQLNPAITCAIVSGADHFYVAHSDQLCNSIEAWLAV